MPRCPNCGSVVRKIEKQIGLGIKCKHGKWKVFWCKKM